MGSIGNSSSLHISGEEFSLLAEEFLGQGRKMSFRASGTSMSPFIRNGDVVEIAPLADVATRVRAGDVVLFRGDKRALLLHRVVRVDAGGVRTRGDGARHEDGFTSRERIMGRVTRVEGEGFNFHLRRPYSVLIARRILFTPRLAGFRLAREAGFRLARLLG